MTPETRRRVFTYGIAIDLVILATGVGLLYPTEVWLLLASFIGAVTLASWKGGWKGAATAIVLSSVALFSLFTPQFNPSHLIAFVGASIVAAAIIAPVGS